MANVNVYSSGSIKAGNRCTVRNSTGRVFTFITAGTTQVRMRRGTTDGVPTAFNNQALLSSLVGVLDVGGACAIDSNDLMHCIYYEVDTSHDGTRALRYVTYDASGAGASTFGTPETVASLDNDDPNHDTLGIVIDANDDPHVVWRDAFTDMGTTTWTVWYSNKISGWATRVTVRNATSGTQNTVQLSAFCMGIPRTAVGSDRPIVMTFNGTTNKHHAHYGNALNATSFNNNIPQISTETGSVEGTMAIDEDNFITFVYILAGGCVMVEHDPASAWGTWMPRITIDPPSGYSRPSVAIIGTNQYVFVRDSGSDIQLWVNDGATDVNTYYADAHTSTTDNDSWQNDANAFDGSTATKADDPSGTGQANSLEGVGTTAPLVATRVLSARVRVYRENSGSSKTALKVYGVDQVTTVLDTTELDTSNTPAWSNWIDLPLFPEGWRLAEMSEFEFEVWNTINHTTTDSVYKIEIEATTEEWVEETDDTDLPNVGTFNDPKVKWAKYNNNDEGELDYVFEDSGGNVLYNTIAISTFTEVPKTYTIDAVFQVISKGKNYTGDAVFQKILKAKTYATDAVFALRSTKNYTLDSIFELLHKPKNYTADSVFEKIDKSKTYNIDAVFLPASVEASKNYTVDAVFQLLNSKTYTVDAVFKLIKDKTYTIDAVFQLLDSKTYTIDSVFQLLNSKTYTIDFVPKKLDRITTYAISAVFQSLEEIKGYSIDAVFALINKSKNYTIDATFALIKSKTYTIDAVFQLLNSKTYSIDSVFEKLAKDKTYTIDATFDKLDKDKTYTTDSIFQKLANFKTYTIDAVFTTLLTEVEKTYSIDAVFQLLNSKTYTIDAVFADRRPKTYTIDSVFELLNRSTNYTIDSFFEKLDRITTYTIDAVFQLYLTKGYSIDAVFELLSKIKTYTIDARFVLLTPKTYTIDSVFEKLAKDKTYTIDSIFQLLASITYTIDATFEKLAKEKTYTVDSNFQLLNSKTYTVDSIFQLLNSKTYTLDAVFADRRSTTYTIDSIFEKLAKDKTYTIDATFDKLDKDKTYTVDAVFQNAVTKGYSIDAIFEKLAKSKTYTIDSRFVLLTQKTYTIDSVFQLLNSKTFTIDSVFQLLNSKTYTIDAVFVLPVTDKDYTIDAVFEKLSKGKTYTIDSVFQKLANFKTYTVDAVFALIKGKTYTIDFVPKKLDRITTYTIDTIFQSLEIIKGYSVDAVFQLLNSKTYTVDAVFQLLDSKTYTIDAVFAFVGGIPKTYTVDAVFQLLASKTYTIDSRFVLRKSKTYTADATFEKLARQKTYTIDARFSLPSGEFVYTIDTVFKALGTAGHCSTQWLKKFGLNSDLDIEEFDTYPTQPEADAIWIPTHANGYVDISDERLELLAVRNNNTLSMVTKDLGASVSDTKFLMRYRQDPIDISGGGVASTDNFFGLSSSLTASPLGNNSTDCIGTTIRRSGVNALLAFTHKNGTSFAVQDHSSFLATEGVPYYIEIRRTSATSVTWNVYSNSNFTGLIETFTRTIPAGVANLRYVQASNLQGVTSSSNKTCLIGTDDIQIADEVDTFYDTPKQQRCYSIDAVFDKLDKSKTYTIDSRFVLLTPKTYTIDAVFALIKPKGYTIDSVFQKVSKSKIYNLTSDFKKLDRQVTYTIDATFFRVTGVPKGYTLDTVFKALGTAGSCGGGDQVFGKDSNKKIETFETYPTLIDAQAKWITTDQASCGVLVDTDVMRTVDLGSTANKQVHYDIGLISDTLWSARLKVTLFEYLNDQEPPDGQNATQSGFGIGNIGNSENILSGSSNELQNYASMQIGSDPFGGQNWIRGRICDTQSSKPTTPLFTNRWENGDVLYIQIRRFDNDTVRFSVYSNSDYTGLVEEHTIDNVRIADVTGLKYFIVAGNSKPNTGYPKDTSITHYDDIEVISGVTEFPDAKQQICYELDTVFKKLDSQAKTYTVDAVFKLIKDKTYTVDSIFQLHNSKTYTIDAVFGTVYEYTIDAVFQLLSKPKTYTIDADFELQDKIKTYTVDTVFKKLDAQFKDYTVDAVFADRRPFNYTIDAVFQKINKLEGYSVDAVFQLINKPKTYTLDATFGINNRPVPYTVDSSFQKIDIPITYTIDAVFSKRKTYTIDSVFKQLSRQFTYLIDTRFVLQTTKTYTIDTVFVLLNSKTYTIDSVFEKLSKSKTYTVDSVFSKLSFMIYDLHATFEKLGRAKTYTIDTIFALIKSKTYTIDATFEKKDRVVDYTIDAVFFKSAGTEKTYTIDAVFRKPHFQSTSLAILESTDVTTVQLESSNVDLAILENTDITTIKTMRG